MKERTEQERIKLYRDIFICSESEQPIDIWDAIYFDEETWTSLSEDAGDRLLFSRVGSDDDYYYRMDSSEFEWFRKWNSGVELLFYLEKEYAAKLAVKKAADAAQERGEFKW